MQGRTEEENVSMHRPEQKRGVLETVNLRASSFLMTVFPFDATQSLLSFLRCEEREAP